VRRLAMPRVELKMKTSLAPEQLMGALLDFTERRPDLWPGLSRKFYEVYEVGDTFARIKEGTSGPPVSVWAREHYDWSIPWRVSWTVEESNFCVPGSAVAMTVSRANGGSNVLLEWNREPSGLRGKLVIPMVARNDGKILRGFIEKALANLEQERDLPTYRPPHSTA
jgi:hypothetical protein